MTLGIVGISVSSFLALLYIYVRVKYGIFKGIFFRVLTTTSYTIFAILALYNVTQRVHIAYIYILIGLVILILGDLCSEVKDKVDYVEPFTSIPFILFAAHKVVNFVALIYLINEIAQTSIFLISAGIAVALTAIIITIAKMCRYDFKGYLIQVICYFLILTYFTTLSVWYYFLMPDLLLFSIYALLFLLHNLVLLKVNIGSERAENACFIIQRLINYAALSVLLAFIYFQLFTIPL